MAKASRLDPKLKLDVKTDIDAKPNIDPKGGSIITLKVDGPSKVDGPDNVDGPSKADPATLRKRRMTQAAGGAAAAGLGLYVAKKWKDKEEDEQKCIAGCLPENWDKYQSGDIAKDGISYKELNTNDEDEPVCESSTTECEEICEKGCEKYLIKDAIFPDFEKGFREIFGGILPDFDFDNLGLFSIASCVLCILLLLVVAMVS